MMNNSLEFLWAISFVAIVYICDINILTEIYDREMKIENWKYRIFEWQRIILGYIVM